MSKKKNKKITPPQIQAPNSSDELVKENHAQKESTSWQKWGTIINLIIALSSLVAIYISYDTAKKTLKNSEIANETSQQSLNVAQDANEISRQSLKAAQNVNEKSLKETQEANEISQQSLKLAEISNRIQVLPIIQWHSETIDNIFSEWKKIDDINDSFNTDDYNINHFEPEGLIFINIGKPMSLQFSCEIVDVYSLLGTISVPTKPPMVFKHEWFIYDTRSHSKPSIFQIIQQDDNTNHLNDKLTIIFRQDKPFIKENMNSKIHQIRPFSNHIDFSPKTHGLDNHYFHFFFAKEHLIKIIYYDLLNNNYEKYFLKKETYSHSGKNITQEINKDEYLKQLLKYKENKYPDLINNQGNIYHVDINDFWTNVDFSLKSIKQATPKLFKWFWAPNHKSIISQSFSQDKATTIEQASQIKQLEDYINSIED